MMHHSEKRSCPRKALQSSGWVIAPATDSWHVITLMDISRDGFAFISPEKLETGSICRFRFQLPGSSRQIEFDGKIMYCAEHIYLAGYRVGVRFSDIDPADFATIEWFIEREISVPSP